MKLEIKYKNDEFPVKPVLCLDGVQLPQQRACRIVEKLTDEVQKVEVDFIVGENESGGLSLVPHNRAEWPTSPRLSCLMPWFIKRKPKSISGSMNLEVRIVDFKHGIYPVLCLNGKVLPRQFGCNFETNIHDVRIQVVKVSFFTGIDTDRLQVLV
jgi:hypothetical protein